MTQRRSFLTVSRPESSVKPKPLCAELFTRWCAKMASAIPLPIRFVSVALEFCSAHATRCMAPAALYFESRNQNRAFFESRDSSNHWVFAWLQTSKFVEADVVGIELSSRFRRTSPPIASVIPRSVACEQLPSHLPCILEVFIWYTALRRDSFHAHET